MVNNMPDESESNSTQENASQIEGNRREEEKNN